MNPYLSVFLEHVLPPLATLLGVVLAALAAKAVQLLEKRVGIEIVADHELKLQELLLQGIARAEEWARKKVKLGEEAPTGAQKFDYALDLIENEVTRLNLLVAGREKLSMLLEAKLGLTR